ncbi:geminin DNA replication inhibitor [Tachypleus tridentatus]|uniref:geminin DNA replication inhibitor n=1 Tax=Tachypleus tridentatus TaxID=6853 RepID=UPI003FD38F54
MYSRFSDSILRESNVNTVQKCQNVDSTRSKRKTEDKRKSLQVLQPSATNQQVLVGRDGIHVSKNKPKMKSKREKLKKRTLDTDCEALNSPAKIRKGTGTSGSEIHKCSEETIQGSKDASFLMSEDIPSAYWKDLAEERRKALEEALKENESLHIQLEVLEEENSQLREIINLAKGLAETVDSIAEDL